MPRWRCPACLGEYTDPQGKVHYYHACAPVLNPATGQYELRPDHRDENQPQEHPATPPIPIPPGPPAGNP